jgi:hypothetical protein
MCLVTRQTSGITPPRDFPKWAEPEIFGLQSVEEAINLSGNGHGQY